MTKRTGRLATERSIRNVFYYKKSLRSSLRRRRRRFRGYTRANQSGETRLQMNPHAMRHLHFLLLLLLLLFLLRDIVTSARETDGQFDLCSRRRRYRTEIKIESTLPKNGGRTIDVEKIVHFFFCKF